MEYEIDENNHQDWLNKGPWYNTSICSVLHGSRFEDFITQARTDRYKLMCSLVAHDRLQLYYKEDEISIGYRAIPDNSTTKKLESLGATINFIYIWLKLIFEKLNARCDAYINAMKVMFRKIPQTIKIALTPKQKVKKLMTYIGCGWYMKKIARGLPPGSRTKLSKNHKKGRIKFEKTI